MIYNLIKIVFELLTFSHHHLYKKMSTNTKVLKLLLLSTCTMQTNEEVNTIIRNNFPSPYNKRGLLDVNDYLLIIFTKRRATFHLELCGKYRDLFIIRPDLVNRTFINKKLIQKWLFGKQSIWSVELKCFKINRTNVAISMI